MVTFKSHQIAFSAPSGAGKTTIVKALLKKYPQLILSISATTRTRRSTEQNGRDYYFLDKKTFERKIEEGAFLEFEQVHGNYYGTLSETVEHANTNGHTVLFDIDVKGALSIKKHYPNACLIFVKPPDIETLKERLRARKSETEESIALRLKRLEFEYEQAQQFSHIVINDTLETAINEVEELICDGL